MPVIRSFIHPFAAILVAACLPALAIAAEPAGADWSDYLGDAGRTHYSTLSKINAANVRSLEQAWVFRAGETRPNLRTEMQCNPLAVDGVLYVTIPQAKLVALDGATGRELWRFDPVADSAARGEKRRREDLSTNRNRGMNFWTDGTQRRILFTAGSFLFAIDPATGKPAAEFGDGGRVDFRDGLERDMKAVRISSTSPGAIWKNLYFLPIRTSEGPGPAAPGHIRAYDVRTGRIVWIFHTIPKPGEYGYDTWPEDAWKSAGGANCWAGMAVDAERGLLFVPTGSPTYDYWGGNRHGQNLFANTLICLDARTGRRVWHYQIVHHDIWDRDLPSPPVLLTVNRAGAPVAAVAQATKSGYVYVFNRATGEPLFPIEERAAPSSDIPGESAWPTQPIPLKPAPFARQIITADDLTTRTPEAHRAALEQFARMRQQVPLQPPSLQETLIIPGLDGGAEWGGAAVDPDGVLYVNASDMGWIIPMAKADTVSAHGSGKKTFLVYCAACHLADLSGNPLQNIPELKNVGSRLKREEILTRITEGKGTMPAFPFLSPKDRAAVATFLLHGEPVGDGGAPADNAVEAPPPDATSNYFDVPYVRSGGGRWLDAEGYPNVKPPWGTLNAIDLNSGDYLWRIPLGEYPELRARGIPPTGADNYGGPVVTAGGVVFIAATADARIRAFDRRNGHLLWQAELPTGGYATPATYMAGGRQYVVIACGGGKLGSKSDDAYVAFALAQKGPVAKGPRD